MQHDIDTVDGSVNVLDQRISDLETSFRLHLQTVFQAVHAFEHPNPGGTARAGAVDLEADSPNPDMEIEIYTAVPYSRNYSAGADRAGAVDGLLMEEDAKVASLNPDLENDFVLPGSADRAGAVDGVMVEEGQDDYIDVICKRDSTKKNFSRTDSYGISHYVELVKHHSPQLDFVPIREDGVTTWQCLMCLCRVDSTRNMIIHCRGKRHRCALIKVRGDIMDWARLEDSCRRLGQFWR